MESMQFDVNIYAPKEKVWSSLWEDANYREWTSAFATGSHAVTDNWKQGSKILFLDGKGSGMVSTIVENRPSEYMSFKHLGEVKDRVEDTSSEAVKRWMGAIENYTLTETGSGTHLLVEMSGNISAEFRDYFLQTWPKALHKLKEIAEANKSF